MKIDVAILPAEIEGIDLSDKVCIVLDIFRATSSIVTSIANGCQAMLPALSEEDASEIAAQSGAKLFAGERRSIKIAGYDFGNSPREFTADKVSEQLIVMTTTNGTVAINACAGSYRTLIGSFLNAAAVCAKVQELNKDVLIVCAGTDRMFSLEDSLCAGLLAERLCVAGGELSDAAQGVRLMYQAARDRLTETAVTSRNGKRLQEINLLADVDYCLSLDRLEVVPQYRDGAIN